MTNKEAIEWIESLVETMLHETSVGPFPDPEFRDEVYEALDMEIKALNQEPILDKIRAEIIHETESNWNVAIIVGMKKAVDIIDKYKTESEE